MNALLANIPACGGPEMIRKGVPLRGVPHLVFQPRVDLRTMRSHSVEALARWTHPTRGELMPADFIPEAEVSGDILGIGAWVLDAAVMQAARWHGTGMRRRVSVNVSPQQIDSGTLPGELRAALARHHVPAETIEIEVTESRPVRDVDAAAATMRTLRAIGVRLAIDDFGVGYAGIPTLIWLPATTLKFDKSLVDRLAVDPHGAAALLKALLAFADSLGAVAVAEGVETLAQLSVLRRLGCHQVQGFIFSRPVECDDVRIDYAGVLNG